jgi:hypothetical protein
MDRLRAIVQALIQHYEKVVLTLMLVVLAGAVWILWQESQREAEKLRQYVQPPTPAKTKGVQPVDLSSARALLDRARDPGGLDLSGPHNLFNPVRWQRQPDGVLLKVQSSKDVGPEALRIEAIRPLYFTISVDRLAGWGSCYMAVSNETLVPARQASVYIYPGVTNRTNVCRFFVLRDVRNPTNDPEWVLELTDAPSGTERTVVVTRDKPYRRVEGWEADLRYPPGNKRFTKLRPGTNWVLRLEGEDYKVVAVTEQAVVLSGRLNDQQYTITQRASD